MTVADYPDWSNPTTVAQYPFAYQGFGETPPVDKTILDAGSGVTVYLFGFDISLDVGGTPGRWFLIDNDAERMIACGYCPAGGSDHVDLYGLQVQGPIVRLEYSDEDSTYAIRWSTAT